VFDITLDRNKLGLSGGYVKGVTDSLVGATSSSRFTVPIFWLDPNTGIGFQVQVQIPQEKMTEQALAELLVHRTAEGTLVRLQDVVREMQRSKMPGEYDRYNMRRLVSFTANVRGEDLGRVAARVREAVEAAGEAPRG